MGKNNFTEKDKEQVIAFLNYIAKNATFTQSVQGSIEFVKLLSHMQQVILPKINDHILEIISVTKPEPKDTNGKTL